jgi:hypothetical protein
MDGEHTASARSRDSASGQPPLRLFLRSSKVEVSSKPPSWLARLMGLHLYSNVLLTKKVRTEMNFAAGLLLLVSVFEWILWTLLFNGIYSSDIFNLRNPELLFAALTGLFFGFAVFWFERQMLTSSEKGWRLCAAFLCRLGYVATAALITSQTFELMLFQKPILERAREEAIRAAAAKHYIEVLDAQAAANQTSTLVPLSAAFEEKNLSTVRTERRNEEHRRNYLQARLGVARAEGDLVRIGQYNSLLTESRDRLDRLLEEERIAEEALRDRLREIESERTKIVQYAADRRKLFQQWISKIRASTPGQPVHFLIKEWGYKDPEPRFFEQLFLLADLREGRPAAWPGATPQIRHALRSKFGFYEPPTCPDSASSPRLANAAGPQQAVQLQEIALDCERRRSATEIYNQAWWAGLLTAMLIPMLILIIKVVLLPEELRFYYSRPHQAELGDIEAQNIHSADERLRNEKKKNRERS